MSRVVSLALLGGLALHAAEEDTWHGVHPTPGAPPEFVYPFDGRSPKIPVQLHNHHETASPPFVTSLRVNGQPVGARVEVFSPGPMVIPAFDYALSAISGAHIYDGTFGAPPTIGESKSYTFDFVLSLPPGATSEHRDQPPNIVTPVTVKFTNLGDTPALTGPITYGGTVRLAGATVAAPGSNVRAEVATPYSPWCSIPLSPAGGSAGTFAFAQALPLRNDWHVRLSADGYETRTFWLGYYADPVTALDVTLTPAPAPDLDYRRIAGINTPTGFWRGAVSEVEGSFVAFPGQEKWKAAATDAEARALRTAARIYKYRFDGARLWEHAPGWETWAGDMTPDGRFVAYALNPIPQTFHVPTENKLVLLDGATGTVIWAKAAAPGDPAVGRRIASLEIAFSPDARTLAVGSTDGRVTLVDRATGNFVWTVPGGAASFGGVRKLKFSPDGQSLYAGSADGALRRLRVSDGAVVWRSYVGGWGSVQGLAFTPEGEWLAVGTGSMDTALVNANDGLIRWQHETQAVDAVAAPDGRHLATAGGQIFRTREGTITGMTKTAGVPRFTPDGRHFLQLGAQFRLHDLGGKTLRTFEASGIDPATDGRPPWAHLSRDGRYAVILASDMVNPAQTGIALYERRTASTTSTAPTIAASPLSQTATVGAPMTLAVSAAGTPPLAYRWQRDGSDVPQGSSATLTLPRVSAADEGRYAVVVTNAAGTSTSVPADVTVVALDAGNPPRIANLSVRASVGGTPLIVGFAIGGAATSGTKSLLIRGAGPALSAFNVLNPARDPRVALFSGSTNVLSNDNWLGDATVSELANRVGAFPFRSATSTDAALSTTAVGGSYTVHLANADAAEGVILAEIYDAAASFAASTPRLVNISARAETGGANALIAGFVVTGSAAKTVLIRGVGPTLAQFNVPATLADPRLTLFRDGAPIAANDDWYDAANALAIASATARVGAFALATTTRDAALMLSLPPGSYTAQVAAAPESSGHALVEVYEVP